MLPHGYTTRHWHGGKPAAAKILFGADDVAVQATIQLLLERAGRRVTLLAKPYRKSEMARMIRKALAG